MQKNKRTAHNKGKPMSEEQKALLRQKALERNKKWKETNTHPIVGQKRSEQTKEKIKIARAKQIITTEQALKAIATRKANGYDIAFFKGKKHTTKTKQKIIKNTQLARERKKQETLEKKNKILFDQQNIVILGCRKQFVDLICLTCENEFSITQQYISGKKYHEQLCSTCYPRHTIRSKDEKEIAEYISSLGFEIESNNRSLLKGKITDVRQYNRELDILVPKANLAIEYCGLYVHSELFKDKNYHYDKLKQCNDQGLSLITIFEDEWKQKDQIVKARLRHKLGLSKIKIAARSCEVKQITSKIAGNFLNQYHIQGNGRSNIRLGCYYKNQLIAVMTFLKGDTSKKVSAWELNRYAVIPNINLIGGAGKLFKFFINLEQPSKVITFADLRWGSGKVYTNIGFKFTGHTGINYWYTRANTYDRLHRFALKKPKNCILTEKELRTSEGWLRIYDCGNNKYVWEKLTQ